MTEGVDGGMKGKLSAMNEARINWIQILNLFFVVFYHLFYPREGCVKKQAKKF